MIAISPPWPLCVRSLTVSVQLLCLLGPLCQGVETIALQQTDKNPSLVSCNTHTKKSYSSWVLVYSQGDTITTCV